MPPLPAVLQKLINMHVTLDLST